MICPKLISWPTSLIVPDLDLHESDKSGRYVSLKEHDGVMPTFGVVSVVEMD